MCLPIRDTYNLVFLTYYTKKILNYMDKGVSSIFWHKNGEAGKIGTSQKAFRNLAEELEKSLQSGLFKATLEGSVSVS